MRILLVAAALMLSMVNMGAVTANADNYLDLPLPNAGGEQRGGVHPSLPLDRTILENALTRHRADGIAPTRYKALLWQYWIVRAANDAGIDLNTWDPQATATSNQRNIFKAYEFYGRLYVEHPELRWMGFASIAAPVFAAGMLDFGALPDFRFYSSMLMSMQKHIFMDLGGMHAAYLGGGIQAVQEMRAAGIIDPDVTAAWQDPPNAVMEFSYREQNLVIHEQFNRMRARFYPPGEVVTYAMTVAGPMPVPGARTPAQYRPLPGGLLPAFNYASQRDRWDYLGNDTVPAYERLSRDGVLSIVTRPFADRVAEFRNTIDLPWLTADPKVRAAASRVANA